MELFEDFLQNLPPAEAPAETIQLTKPQQECVDFRTDGAILVRGIAGSGKTTVLLARAQRFLKEEEGQVLVLTFNKTLARFARALALKAGLTGERMMVAHFHEWMARVLERMGVPRLPFVNDQERKEKVRYARNIVRKQADFAWTMPTFDPDERKNEFKMIEFLAGEIAWIKGEMLRSKDEYLKAERTGRGHTPRLDQFQRVQIWAVYEKYSELLRNNRVRDFDDVAVLLCERANKVPAELRPAHVLVDEAQDLTRAQLMALAMMQPVTMTIAADKGQKIYRRPFTFARLGINVRGVRSKQLTETHRSTRQIIGLAKSLQQHDALLLKDEEFVPDADSSRDGERPELWRVADAGQELELIARLASEGWGPPGAKRPTIGIFAPTNDRLREIAEKAKERSLPWVLLSEEGSEILTPGLKLVTYHSARGLEFDQVICTGLKEGELPRKNRDPGEDDDAHLSSQRALLYVGITRAKNRVTLIGVKKVSQFIDELDKRFYKDRS